MSEASAGPEAALTTSARVDDRNTEGSGQVPPSVVEALARIAQTLEEQKLLLTAKSDASSQPPSPSPVIPLYCTAERPESPASFESTPGLLFSNAIRRSAPAPIPSGKTANLETDSRARAAPKKEVRAERQSTAELASGQEEKAKAREKLVPKPPTMSGYPPIAKKGSESRKVWTKALSLAAFAGILTLVLLQKFPLLLGTVKAGVPGRSAMVQPAGYSVSKRSSESAAVTSSMPDTNKARDFRNRRTRSSDQSQDVVVRRFATDLGITSKNSHNKQELKRIFFNQDSDVIDSQYRPWLRQLAEALAKDSTAIVTLKGHTDDLGREAHNRRLSSRRADAVRNALVNEFHVPKARLIATGEGSDAPLQPNSSAEGRAYNRRVEVRLKHVSD